MIESFWDRTTAALFADGEAKGVDEGVAKKVHKRLHQLQAATDLRDLAFPPSNQLKKRQGENAYQIRVDRRWRITFTWKDGKANNVRFWDPH